MPIKEMTLKDFRIDLENAQMDACRLAGLAEAIEFIDHQVGVRDAPPRIANALSCLISLAATQADMLSDTLSGLTNVRIRG